MIGFYFTSPFHVTFCQIFFYILSIWKRLITESQYYWKRDKHIFYKNGLDKQAWKLKNWFGSLYMPRRFPRLKIYLNWLHKSTAVKYSIIIVENKCYFFYISLGPFWQNFGNSLDQCLNPMQHPPNFYEVGEQPLVQQELWLPDFYLKVCLFRSNIPVLYYKKW